jgi:hypothetical protein
LAHDQTFDPTDLLDVGDNPLSHSPDCGRRYRKSARGNVDSLAGEFPSIFEHQPAQQDELDALVTASVFFAPNR